MKRILLALALTTILTNLFAQTKTISGKINDASNRESLIGASIIVKGTTIGVITDADGKFTLDIPETAKTLVVTYLGYEPREISVGSTKNFSINLEPSFIIGGEVVVTSSRVSEALKEAPMQIEKMTAKEIKNASSGDFYQSLGNFKGIDLVTSSAGLTIINLRGFGDTRSFRTKQFIDGVDNESPGLNMPLGNLVGGSDLDLESVEVISGASSALYGANAMQGVISMTTKNPYDYQGLSFKVNGGYTTSPAGYIDGQFRYAQAFGKEQKFAIKISGGFNYYSRDWIPNDSTFNRYGDLDTVSNPTTVDLSKVVRQNAEKPYGPGTDQTLEEHNDFVALGNWLDFNPWASPGKLRVKAPGYDEIDLIEPRVKRGGIRAQLHYRFKPDLELSATYQFGYGTAVFQSSTRYQIKDFTYHAPKLSLKGKNFEIKTYYAIEDAGNSMNIGLTGAYLTRAGIRGGYVPEFLGKYFDVLDTLTNGFCADCIGSENQAQTAAIARAAAFTNAEKFWFKKGSREFDSVYNKLVTNPDAREGTKFFDRSSMFHLEGQYTFDFIKAVDLMAGASYRLYMPNSRGTIFEDTAGRVLRVQEVGGFIQASKRLAKDKLRIIGSVRLDKNSNFPVQFSPRLSFVITPTKDHTVRISAGRAFRLPTLQEQYLNLNIGDNFLVGNLKGKGLQYTQRSVDILDSLVTNKIMTIDQIETQMPNLLKTIDVKPLKSELVTTVDLGYRGEFLNKKLFIDFSSYFSYYERFLGFTRIAAPVLGSVADGTALDQIYASVTAGGDTNYYKPLQLYVNLDKPVPSWGASISVSYYVGKGIRPYVNYTYADLYDKPLKEAENLQLTGFNTPRHKINVGLNANRVWKGLGFSANFKWVPDYEWQGPMGDGIIRSYHNLDLNVSYEFEKIYSTLRIGGANIYNLPTQTAIAAPFIGARYFVGWEFDLANFGRNN